MQSLSEIKGLLCLTQLSLTIMDILIHTDVPLRSSKGETGATGLSQGTEIFQEVGMVVSQRR